jgi:hypothetical protein
MLKKSVCKECVNAAAVAWRLRKEGADLSWNNEDDSHWKNGFLFCPIHKSELSVNAWGKVTIQKAQRNCARKEEHTRRKHEED